MLTMFQINPKYVKKMKKPAIMTKLIQVHCPILSNSYSNFIPLCVTPICQGPYLLLLPFAVSMSSCALVCTAYVGVRLPLFLIYQELSQSSHLGSSVSLS